MKKVETIIAELKNQLYWSQPNLRFNELMSLVTELENTLFPSETLVSPEPEVIAEPIVEEVVEETVAEVKAEVEETVSTEKSTKKK